jgi:hypothetical protein
VASGDARRTHRIEQIINDVLKRMILRLDPEPVVPSKAIPHDEAAQDIVRADDPNNAKGEEGQSYPESEE